MPDILVIGATGVAGSAAIEAAKSEFGADAHITGVWFGHQPPENILKDLTAGIEGDISDSAMDDRIRDEAGLNFHYLFFATALGDVGFPVESATPDQVAAACRLSFDPLPRLIASLNIGVAVGYSTFYNLKHQRLNYGAMGHAKEKIEVWTVGAPGRTCIRAGAFPSASSKAIKLLIRRRAKELAESGNPILEDLFRNRKPSEAVELFEQAIMEEERQVCGDTGTTRESLVEAHRFLFRNPAARFVNVCGKKIWPSEEPQRL